MKFGVDLSNQDLVVCAALVTKINGGILYESERVQMLLLSSVFPLFNGGGYDSHRLDWIKNTCADHMAKSEQWFEKLDAVYEAMRNVLPQTLYGTAYLFTCMYVMTNGALTQQGAERLARMKRMLRLDANHASWFEKSAIAYSRTE